MTSLSPSVETAEKSSQSQGFKSHHWPHFTDYKIILKQLFVAFSVQSDLSGKLSW